MFPLDAKILVTGARGLVGCALIEELKEQGYENVISLTRDVCDLSIFSDVTSFFEATKPDIVFHLAASVYGIGGNAAKRGSIFLNNNLMNTHVIEASRQVGVKKIIAMGTIAAYPQDSIPPIKEETIWNGIPHDSEKSYAHVKRAMLAHLEAYYESYNLDYAYVISTNLYGPHDKFDVQFGHVIPSLIRKFYEAKLNDTEVYVWGDGTSSRDFLYSKDMAHALFLVMNKYSGSINIASGKETKIKDVTSFLGDYFSIQDRVKWDASKSNGRCYYPIDLKNMNSIFFKPAYSMQEGLKETVDWFCSNYSKELIRV